MAIALDSGITSRAATRNDLRSQLQSAIAHQAGVPITSISLKYEATFIELSNKFNIPLLDQGTRIDELAEHVSQDTKKYVSFVLELEARVLISTVSFPNPLYRYIKDYYLARIAEAFQIYWMVQSPSNSSTQCILQPYFPFSVNGRFKVAVLLEESSYIVVGPLFCDEQADEGVERKYRQEIKNEFRLFSTLARHTSQHHAILHLHGSELINRSAFSRQKLNKQAVEQKIRYVLSSFTVEKSLKDQLWINSVPPNFFSKLAAAVVACESQDLAAFFNHKVYLNGSDVKVRRFEVDKAGNDIVCRMHESSEVLGAHTPLYHLSIEQAYANWSLFVSESLGILQAWLRKNAGALGPRVASPEAKLDFCRRLSRFLAFLFNCGECSIYEVVYDQAEARLVRFSGYSRYPSYISRLDGMQRHINRIAHSPLGNSSIVVRAFRSNELQYCQWHDQLTGMHLPRDQPISYPPDMKDHDWGTSLCALPIRVSGLLWGVIEFVAMRPHSFPDVVRSRISETVATFAPYLYEQEVFATLGKINEVVVSDVTAQEKKARLRPLTKSLFSAKTFAILSIDGPRLEDVKVFLSDGRNDIQSQPSSFNQKALDYLKPYLRFSDSKDSIWSAKIGDDVFQEQFSGLSERQYFHENRGDFICLARVEWSGGEGERRAGVAVLTYDHEMDDQENWRSIIEFGCQYIATVTTSLYGSEAWETTVREKIAHEFSKSVTALHDTNDRLETAVDSIPKRQAGLDKSRFEKILGDLRRHERALGSSSRILKKNRVTRDFESDPRLYYIANIISEWRVKSPRPSTKFREIYNAIFIGAKSAFFEKGIAVPALDRGMDPTLDIEEGSLAEVLLTLKSNIIKYGLKDTDVLVRESSAINYGIRISNIGFKMTVAEQRSIFFDEFRGEHARAAHPDDGSGFGLWYAERVMKELDGDIRYGQSDLSHDTRLDHDRYAWHHFTLSFPHSKVIR
ncbi:MAG: HAMP domain-containing histidine kinase [Methylocystaceae bacterium]|nr:HAMP domain-containing histidine kinase [Methylocystaceae bacterium]